MPINDEKKDTILKDHSTNNNNYYYYMMYTVAYRADVRLYTLHITYQARLENRGQFNK